MRLLELSSHNRIYLQSFDEENENGIPPYAILSHTWGLDEDEVKFKDVTEGSGKGRLGYNKIKFCAKQAAVDKLQFFWVDTCCIKKEDSSELQEAITSMFRWYQNATKCYVYLPDVHSNHPLEPWEQAFRKSRWFTRGWTLQELIAPNVVEFYSSEGELLGDKSSLEALLHEITGIPLEILRNGDLSKIDNREKFQWVSSRQTKRSEDKVYSLLGIFSVSLVMNYGEGYDNALHRLMIAIEEKRREPANFPDIPLDPYEVGKRFQTAWMKLTAPLSDENRDEFRKVQAEHVKSTIISLQLEQENKRSMMSSNRLKEFFEGMSNLVQISGLLPDMDRYVAYIWGPMKFMLLTASHYPETFDPILCAYEAMGERLTFLITHEQMFKQYPLMQRITGWIYSDLLEVHIKSQQHLRGRGWKQVFKADWEEFWDLRFQGIIGSLQRHKDLTESLARFVVTSGSSDINLYIMEKLNLHSLNWEKSSVELENKEQREREKKYGYLTEWLDSWRPVEDKLKREQVAEQEFFCEVRKKNPGSGDWILKNEMIAGWLNDDTPRNVIMWLNGIPGAGKTILASRIIEECQKTRGFITSYFYCKESDPQRRNCLSILKGLLAQMVTQERKLVPYFYKKAKSSGQVTLVANQLSQSLFKVACDRITKQFIVIDGLDECPREDRRVLLSFLAEVVDQTEEDDPGKLRILIVSQAESDIAETLSKDSRARPNFSVERFNLQPKHNKDDIENFVNMWTDKIQRNFGLCFEETECIKRLTFSRANGMFLYAKLVMENLHNQVNKSAVVAELDERQFPAGLAEAYSKILGRLERRWKGTERVWSQITHLLGFMICAKRPLKTYEIQCALCLHLNDEVVSLHDVESSGLMVQVKELCGTLVHELPGERLELVHSTARKFLAETPYISKPDVECELATLCLKYLTLDIFDPSLENTEINNYIIEGWLSFQDYAVSKWFQHLNALAKLYNEEGFQVEDSSTALQSLNDPICLFLDRYIDDISAEELQQGVKDDFAKLFNETIYDDVTRIMSHVTRLMEKGPESRNEICVESLKKAFERNRQLIEQLSTESPRNSSNTEALVRFYGPRRFKCSYVTCIDFYQGFTNAKMRDKHINKHNRPWICEVLHCTSATFGFTSNKELEKHVRDFHPDKSDLSALFKLTPKKVINSSDHVCHICGKQFSRNFHKINHINSHMGARPYACTECGKTFTRDNDRKRHEKIHSRG